MRLIILYLSLAIVFAQTCKTYGCNPAMAAQNSNGSSFVCFNQTVGNVGMAVCPNQNFTCSVNGVTNPNTLPSTLATCTNSKQNTNIKPQSRFPGDLCQSNDDCFKSSNCTNGICMSTIASQGCNGQLTGSCPQGTYCNATSRCSPILPLGAPCAQLDNPCGFMAMCGFQNMTSTMQTCIRLYSFPNGALLKSNIPMLCQSNFTAVIGGSVFCMPGPVSLYNPSVGMQLNQTCQFYTFTNASNFSMI